LITSATPSGTIDSHDESPTLIFFRISREKIERYSSWNPSSCSMQPLSTRYS